MTDALNGNLRYRELKSPVTVQMALTERCNNICLYCYNSCRGEAFQSSGLDLDSSLRIAKQIVDNEVFECVLTGGEPLLRRDLLYPIGAYLSSENVDVKMNTNLVLVEIDDPKKIKDSGMLGVFGSLSSYDERTYNNITQSNNFRRALKGIEILVANNIPTAINMVVLSSNKDQVYETGKFLKNIGVNSFCATPASPCDYMVPSLELTRDEIVRTLDDLLRLKEEFGMNVDVVEPLPRCIAKDSSKYEHFLRRDCAAGKITVYVTPEGDVTPCTHVSKSYGNLLQENLKDIWLRMSEWRDGSRIPLKCKPCAELELCSTGCREAAKMKTGSYQGMDIWTNEAIQITRNIPVAKKQLSDYDVFRVAPGLKIREEKEGYSIFNSNTHSIIYATPDLLNFILNLKQRKNFTLKELIEEFEDKENVCELIKLLNNREVIKK